MVLRKMYLEWTSDIRKLSKEEKKHLQLREMWVKNVMRCLGFTEDEAKIAYIRIRPFGLGPNVD